MEIVYWLGILFFLLPILVVLGGPKRDKRFKTGYKNNEMPMGCAEQLSWILGSFVVGFSLIKIASYADIDNDFLELHKNVIINFIYLLCLIIALITIYFKFIHKPDNSKKKDKSDKASSLIKQGVVSEKDASKSIKVDINGELLYFHPASREYLNLLNDLKIRINEISQDIKSERYDIILSSLVEKNRDIKQLVKLDYIDALMFIDPNIGDNPSKDAFTFYYLFSNDESYKLSLINGVCEKKRWDAMRYRFKSRDNSFSTLKLLSEIEFPYLDKYVSLLNQIAFVLCKSDGIILKKEQELLQKLRSTTSSYLIKDTIPNDNYEDAKDEEALDSLLAKLNSLVGLSNVKEEVFSMINFLRVQKERSKEGLKNVDLSLHCIFKGPPGTGKTTVARILSKILFELGYLKENKIIETDRSGLVAGFVGQTATKTTQVIDSAINGVLFIDEAYLLYNDSNIDFGREAIGILLKRMEDNRKELAVILAGYDQEMDQLIALNPGLESRISRQIIFEDFNVEELYEIFQLICSNSEYELDEVAKVYVLAYISYLYDNKTESFGNAREMRNLFEQCIENHATRLGSKEIINSKDLVLLTSDDIPEFN